MYKGIDIFSDGPNLTIDDYKKLEQYERIIPILDSLYELGEPCINPETGNIVTNSEYDKMRDFVFKAKPNSKIFKNVTASNVKVVSKICKHNPPLTSISKANGSLEERKKILDKWINDVKKEIGYADGPEKWACQSYKRDGVALALYYEKGILVRAGLRPRDGVDGKDVTDAAKGIQGVPERLPLPLTLSIRGEAECRISVFERLNGSTFVDGQEFANPRNYTAGSLQLENTSKAEKREISFVGYSIVNLENPPYKTEIEMSKWANTVLKIPFVRKELFKFNDLERLESLIPKLDYEVDGIIIEVNNLEDQEQLGREGNSATGNPKGKIAWKFNDETADVIVKDIVWETGRTGLITPVMTFKAATLAGTAVRRCAGYNLGFLARNEIKKETKIKIRKSGKIIPETLGYYDKENKFINKKEPDDPSLPDKFDKVNVEYPEKCPSCGEKTIIKHGQKNGMLDLICSNSISCPAQNVKRFVNYLQVIGCKGLAESVTTKLVESGLVKKISDFYELTVSQIIGIDITKRTALLTIARIHMVDSPDKIKDNKELAIKTLNAVKNKKIINLSKFISALGIHGVSKGAGTALSAHFRDLDSILNASEKDLLNTPDVGEKTAKAIFEFIEMHRDDIVKLKEFIEIELPRTGKFTNKNFVFTGSVPGGKEMWKEAVEFEGGVIKSSVSKKTDYVVVGDDPGSKYDKAKDLHKQGFPINIIDFYEFKKLIGEK